MDVKPRPASERVIESSIALMIPALLLLWFMLERTDSITVDDSTVTLGGRIFGNLTDLFTLMTWPIAKGWPWAAGVLALATLFRFFGYGKEALLVLGTQGGAILAFSVLQPVTKHYPPRLDVLVYTTLALTLVVLIRRFLPKLATRPLNSILLAAWSTTLVTIWSVGHSPVTIILSALLGIAAVATLTVGMR